MNELQTTGSPHEALRQDAVESRLGTGISEMGTFRKYPKVVSIGQLSLHWTFPWKITGREYSLCSAELEIRTTDLSCNLARKLCQIGPNFTDAYSCS